MRRKASPMGVPITAALENEFVADRRCAAIWFG